MSFYSSKGLALSSSSCSRLLRMLCLKLTLLYALSLSTTTSPCESATRRAALDDRAVVEEQLGYLPHNYLSVSARTQQGAPIAIKTYPLLRKKKHNSNENQIPLLDTSSAKLTLGTPFPTHFWLTCPAISRAIGELERMGYIGMIVDYLNLSESFHKRQQLLQCHQQCGPDRWDTLSPLDRASLEEHAATDPTFANMKFMISESGISGLDYQSSQFLDLSETRTVMTQVSIKCLHTHYAHFCSTTTSEQRMATTTGTATHEPADALPAVENPIGRITHNLLRAKFPSLEL